MKRASTIFLQVVIVLFGIGILAWLLWEPHVEGVNAHATFFEVYLSAFIAYIYVGSIPFFVAIYQAVKLLSYVGRNEVFSERSVRALRIIKYCSLIIIGFVAVSALFMIGGDRDDRPAGVFLRLLITFPSIVIGTTAAVFERILQNGVETKSENDLTV
ncbi:MAG TPA: DUF2975 domain-containing protein [Pyrinomonadaceae bacterium]|nr:DUF2975 domain-containing protein [Pyrinomonadaceae bacterium]